MVWPELVLIRDGLLVRPQLSVTYPIIEGLENKIVQRRLNCMLLNSVNTMIKNQGYDPFYTEDMRGGYEVTLNERGLVSIILGNYTYLGGAKGLTLVRSVSFEVTEGRVFSLKDLFKPGADYSKRLSKLVQKQAEEDCVPLPKNKARIRVDHEFYLTPEELVVYYQLSEVTSCEEGILYFSIPLADIRDLLGEESPLNRLLR
ncbi:MAG: DUF3298 and DUF4163 domain-containing protein [Firmicutes bacterium]|nr:DUF3298 and DUF4163 domain-containing protein [Bacillota bacterium]